MTSQEAKKALALYRPEAGNSDDLEIAAALEQTRRDPELNHWFEKHCAFQSAMREKLQQIRVPPGLKETILANHKIVRLTVWRQRPVWLAAAAGFVLLIGLAALWFKPETPDRFSIYRSRMISAAQRLYTMDIVTNDLAVIRQFLASHNAPADYALPQELEKLTVTGAKLVRWESKPVSMVCFDRGDQQMLFLFVVHRTALQQPPPVNPMVETVNTLQTISWTRDDNTYLLAAPADTELLRKYR